jgi:hypothetical protein
MLKSRMLQVFDLAVSRQLAAKGIRILRLKRKTSKTCVDDLFTRSYRRFAELLTKSNRVLRKGESPSVHGLRQDGIRQWLDISHAICARKPLSVLLAGKGRWSRICVIAAIASIGASVTALRE